MATKVIEVSTDHQRRGLLCPASWPSVYTVFISIICLIYALVAHDPEAESRTVHRDVEDGIRLLACTACSTDTGSVRCLEVIRRLLENGPSHIKIDITQICANTKPCCTTDFRSRIQPVQSNLNNLPQTLVSLSQNMPMLSKNDSMLRTSDQEQIWRRTSNGSMYSLPLSNFDDRDTNSNQSGMYLRDGISKGLQSDKVARIDYGLSSARGNSVG